MLSASKALACVHTEKLSETQKWCEGMCMCLSVNVLCVSSALLRTTLVPHQLSSLSQSSNFSSSFVFPWLLSVFFSDIYPSHALSFSCKLHAAGQDTVLKLLQLSLRLRKTQGIAVSGDIKVYRVFIGCALFMTLNCKNLSQQVN